MTLLGNFVRTREQGEQSIFWRSINGMNSMGRNARALSFLIRTRILASHASFSPFVLSERILFSLSGHLDKISQQSHLSALIGINLNREFRQEAGGSVGARADDVGMCAAFIAFMVARGWGWDHVPPRLKSGEQDTATHQRPY